MTELKDSKTQAVWTYNFCRYAVAFVIIVYGWAKLMGSQFTILDSELDKPMGEVSGFWLTWYYFGYSPFYGNFVALVQIAAGFMLLRRKTVLLGACVLFGVVGNIILIDIFYGIDVGALGVAILLAGALFYIIDRHRSELIEIFWTRQNSVVSDLKNSSALRRAKIAAVALIIAVPPSCTYYIANYNNRLPTELDGKWRVASVSAPFADGDKPLTRVYFEHNRAYMTVFRFGDDRWRTHHFELDSQNRQINIWEKWLSKGAPVFAGNYELAGDRLVLEGELKPANQSVVIELEKR